MATVKPPASSFAQKALTIIFGAAITAMITGLGVFFYWLAGSTMKLMETTTRIEGQVIRIEQQVASLANTRERQAREQVSRNTRRLEELEQDGGEP